MQQYKIKKIIPGYKIGFTDIKKVVAVPLKKLEFKLMIQHKDQWMILYPEDVPLDVRIFEDKFRDNEVYKLGYFEWKPTEQLKLLKKKRGIK